MSDAEPLMRFDFRTIRVEDEEKERILDSLKGFLEGIESLVFAYVHGGFVDLEDFRDVDVAVWVRDPEEAFRYAVDLSARLERQLGVPVDIHVFNDAPLRFKRHVFTEGRLLLSFDEGLRLKVLDETLRRYFDLKELERANIEAGSVSERRERQAYGPVRINAEGDMQN